MFFLLALLIGSLAAGDCVPDHGPSPRPVNRIGWQGLFYDRLEGHLADEPLALVPPLPHAPAGTPEREPLGLYLVRNRVYSPALGRFLQRDPNETALPVLGALASNASTISALVGPFVAAAHYADGMNLYTFAGGNPVMNRDPLGLSLMDDVDSLIGEIAGQRVAAGAAVSSTVGRSFSTALALGQFAFSFLPGADAITLAATLAMGGSVGLTDILMAGAGMAGPFGKALGATVGMVGKYALKRLGSRLMAWGDSLIKGVAGLFKRCNCFVAGTVVDTAGGAKAIECIGLGEQVVTRNQHRAGDANQLGMVTNVFKNIAPAIIWLAFATGETLGTTAGHEVWTVERGWSFVADLSVGEHMVYIDGAALKIAQISLDPTPTVVYNLEVDGTFTYYANGVWVHNNSKDITCSLRNGKLAGTKHPISGVPFDQSGFPDFSQWVMKDVRVAPTGNPRADFAAANRAAGYSDTPAGYTWHHHQDSGRMQLVPTDLHARTAHTGGASLWAGGY